MSCLHDRSATNWNIYGLVGLCLLLGFGLTANAMAYPLVDPGPVAKKADAGHPNSSADPPSEAQLTTDDSDDDVVLAISLATAVPSSLLISFILLHFLRLSERWPPPLHPPQVYSSN